MSRFYRKLLLHTAVCGLLSIGLSACDDGGGSNNQTNTKEPPQVLPNEFTDVFGATWRCPAESDLAVGSVSGELRFPNGAPISRADIVHLSINEIDGDNVRQISSKCLNNIVRYDVSFELRYQEDDVAIENRYALATRFFKKQEDGSYQITMEPDGLHEVINNEIYEDIAVLVEPL